MTRERPLDRRSSRMNAPAGNPNRYDDMIGLGHPISKTHSPMARIK